MNADRIGNYVIREKIGQGGMGEVYLAQHSETEKVYALKLMVESRDTDEKDRVRFLREIDTLQQFKHPNIIEVVDFDFEEEPYYVMEYVEGGSLSDRLKKSRTLPWPVTIDFAIQICQGLKNAHDHGVIHRDLKPSNLLITEDNQLKIVDFGIARGWNDANITRTGSIIGSPYYMSPEQASGEEATPKSDLYSLGAVIYTMLTGVPAFSAEAPLKVIALILTKKLVPPIQLNGSVPIELNDFVCHLMKKNPEERPRSAYAVLKILEDIREMMISGQTDQNSFVENPIENPLTGDATVTADYKPGSTDTEDSESESEDKKHLRDKASRLFDVRCKICFYSFTTAHKETRCPNCDARIYGLDDRQEVGTNVRSRLDNKYVEHEPYQNVLERFFTNQLLGISVAVLLISICWSILAVQFFWLVSDGLLVLHFGHWALTLVVLAIPLLAISGFYYWPYDFNFLGNSGTTIVLVVTPLFAMAIYAQLCVSMNPGPPIPTNAVAACWMGLIVGLSIGMVFVTLGYLHVRFVQKLNG